MISEMVDTEMADRVEIFGWYCAAPADPDPDPDPDPNPDPDPDPDPDPKPDGKPFSPEQEQYIGSWMGRIIKKQFDESIVPLIQSNQQVSQPYNTQADDVLKKFNEEISEELFTNPVGAIQKTLDAINRAKTNVTQTQKVQVERELTSFSDDPLYKDIYQDMKNISHERTGAGYPPKAAAEYALARAKLNYFENKNSQSGDGFNLADGGRPTGSSKTLKLPPEFKKAYLRDKEKGLFKSEADYIGSLSPVIREKYGI